MNIQSGRVQRRTNLKSEKGSLSSRLALVFRLAIILFAIGFLANAYIFLNQKIAESSRDIRTTKVDIHNTNREIQNLKIQKASLSSGQYISDSIKRFGLKLKQADPSQIHRLVVYAPGVVSQLASVAERREEHTIWIRR